MEPFQTTGIYRHTTPNTAITNHNQLYRYSFLLLLFFSFYSPYASGGENDIYYQYSMVRYLEGTWYCPPIERLTNDYIYNAEGEALTHGGQVLGCLR